MAPRTTNRPVFITDAEAPTASAVDHPPHYAAADDSGIECIDAVRAALGREQFLGYLRGQAIAYLWRAGRKSGAEAEEDARKAEWYSGRLAKEI